MPSFLANSPRITLKINDIALTSPAPFAAGHVLTDNEAKFLNRQVTTAVANGIPARIHKAVDGYVNKDENGVVTPLSAEELQAKFDAVYAAYELGAANRGGAPGEPTDPIERGLRRMAVDFINARLKAKGKNINEVRKAQTADGKSVYEGLLTQAIDANPSWRDLVQAQVQALASTADDLELDFGGADTQAAAAE